MICMLCDHTANTMGCFWDLQVSKCLCVFAPICLFVRIKRLLQIFSAPEIETSPVGEPATELCYYYFFFLGGVGEEVARVRQHLPRFPDCGSCSSLLPG